MATCPNINLDSWKNLVAARGEDVAYYLWDKYDGNVPQEEYIPTIKPGVEELFDSSPELANAVHKALGFNNEKIVETAKGSTYKYLPDGKTQRFKKVEGKEHEPQDILTFVPNYEWIKSNNPQWLEKQGLENDTQYTQYLLEKVQGKGKVWIVDSKGKKIETNQDAKTADRLFIAFGKKDGTVEDFIPVSKEPVIGFYTYDSRIHFDEKGERYRDRHLGNKVVKITEGITPQQKQQAQQIYSQYLEQNPNGSIEQFKSWISNRNTFDKELAQKIQDKLQRLYPEIKLNITNNPIWEKGDNVFNQEEYNNQVNYRLKATEKVLDNLAKIKQWESNKSIDKNTLWKKIGELGISKQQLELLKESEGNTIEEKLTNFVADYSYAIQIKIAKETIGVQGSLPSSNSFIM